MAPPQQPLSPQPPPPQWAPPPYPYPPPYYQPPKSDAGKIVLIVVVVIVAFVLVTIVLSAILYLMVSGSTNGGPGPGPQTIGISRRDTSTNWVLEIATVPAPHALTTTTFLMRWPTNSSTVNPPGQASLQSLKTASAGVQYLPRSGSGQTDLRVSDVITISKSYTYIAGMQVTITDGTSVLWSGTL